MKKLIVASIFAAAAVAASASLLDFRGMVTDKSDGWRFQSSGGNGGSSFNPLEGWYPDKGGKLISPRIAIPKTGAYYKLSFTGFAPERAFEAVAFYDGAGNMIADNYDVLYGGEVGVQSWSWRKDDSVCEVGVQSWSSRKDVRVSEVGEKEAGEKKEQIPLSNSNSKLQLDSPTKNSNSRHYERIVFVHEGVKEVEVFFQSTKGCTVSDVRFEPATVEEAAAWCDKVYAKLPPVKVEPTGNAFLSAPKTLDALKTGKPWRILMLGDSIVQDTFHSQFHALVKRAYPKSDITWLVSVRGSTGCWYYRFPENFEKYVTAYRPDCVIVGGISNWRAASRDFPVTGNDAIFEVGEKIRASGVELIVVSPALSVDTRMKEGSKEYTPLAPREYDAAAEAEALALTIDKYANKPSGLSREGFAELKEGCAKRGWGYIDAFTPSYRWLYESGLPWSWYSRDYVHSGELGKQVLARIMLEYFTAAPLAKQQ